MEMNILSKVSQTDKYCIFDVEAKGGLCGGNRESQEEDKILQIFSYMWNLDLIYIHIYDIKSEGGFLQK